jgi:hypothetical protein
MHQLLSVYTGLPYSRQKRYTAATLSNAIGVTPYSGVAITQVKKIDLPNDVVAISSAFVSNREQAARLQAPITKEVLREVTGKEMKDAHLPDEARHDNEFTYSLQLSTGWPLAIDIKEVHFYLGKVVARTSIRLLSRTVAGQTLALKD